MLKGASFQLKTKKQAKERGEKEKGGNQWNQFYVKEEKEKGLKS